jgi:hypothetical protein
MLGEASLPSYSACRLSRLARLLAKFLFVTSFRSAGAEVGWCGKAPLKSLDVDIINELLQEIGEICFCNVVG